jgi:hypothetical protein
MTNKKNKYSSKSKCNGKSKYRGMGIFASPLMRKVRA